MKGLFIPDITAEMFRNGCLEGIETLMAEGEIYDIEYEPDRKGKWIYWREGGFKQCKCSECLTSYGCMDTPYCPNCGADMRGENDDG